MSEEGERGGERHDDAWLASDSVDHTHRATTMPPPLQHAERHTKGVGVVVEHAEGVVQLCKRTKTLLS